MHQCIVKHLYYLKPGTIYDDILLFQIKLTNENVLYRKKDPQL